MSVKYVVRPGFVISKNDGDRHWISFHALIGLYGVNPAECVEAWSEQHLKLLGDCPNLTWLVPQYDGDYSLPGKD